MQLAFEDGSSIEVERLMKTWDFTDNSIMLHADFDSESAIEVLKNADVSSFNLVRGDVVKETFEGYSIMNASTDYEEFTTRISVSFTKSM